MKRDEYQRLVQDLRLDRYLDEMVNDNNVADQPSEVGPDSWLCRQIITYLGEQAGQALITASQAHGVRCNTWLCEQVGAAYPEIISNYRGRLRRQTSRTQLVRKEQTDG